MQVQIANPIYDVVFKFLMEDNRVAKTLLSALIGHEILELDFLPQELSMQLGAHTKSETRTVVEQFSLTIYRMDFSAKIRTEAGEQQIIIELQKARLAEDITRFRSYLGKQYQNQDLFVWIKDKKKKYKAGIPIFAIYFLGYELKAFEKIPVVLIENLVRDRFTKAILDKKEPFISSLFHEGMIVNIPALNGKRRDELEKLLSIFDQANRVENFHILNIDEQDFPEEYRPVIRRLQVASKSKDVREKMIDEDNLLQEFLNLETALEESELKLKEFSKKNEQLEAKAEQLEAKAEQLEAKAEKAQADLEVMNQKLALAVRAMSAQGLSAKNIAEMFGISTQEVEKIL